MKIGNYVQYKSQTFLVYEINGDKAKIYSPVMGKRYVNMVNLTYINLRPAVQVEHKGFEYLVTAKGLILSLVTGRVMKWKQYHKERIEILRKSGGLPAMLKEQAI